MRDKDKEAQDNYWDNHPEEDKRSKVITIGAKLKKRIDDDVWDETLAEKFLYLNSQDDEFTKYINRLFYEYMRLREENPEKDWKGINGEFTEKTDLIDAIDLVVSYLTGWQLNSIIKEIEKEIEEEEEDKLNSIIKEIEKESGISIIEEEEEDNEKN